MIKTIKVSDKGQIAIPQLMRVSLDINTGDDLTIIQLDNKLLIEKSAKTEQKLTDTFRDILRLSERSLKEVWDNKSDDIWSNCLKK